MNKWLELFLSIVIWTLVAFSIDIFFLLVDALLEFLEEHVFVAEYQLAFQRISDFSSDF
jgi:hypothetical protein